MTPSTSAVAVCWSSASDSSAVRSSTLLFQLGVGFLQIAGHAVELPGERFEFVAGMDLDAAVEFAGADALGARLQSRGSGRSCGGPAPARARVASDQPERRAAAAVRNAAP